ncbi:MAG: alpha-galactosidase [Sphaerochaetaceae bacterium]|nr:alpha-galactosidase [Sphaerochaetaceae bacterium]
MISIKNKVFHLSTKRTSYVFALKEGGIIEHLYYGHRITAPEDYISTLEQFNRERKPSELVLDEESGYQSADCMSIVSSEGFGDFRVPEFAVSYTAKKLRALDLRYESHKIFKGIRKMSSSLPQTYGDNATSLELCFMDPSADVTIKIIYTIFDDSDVISRRAIIENSSKDSLLIRVCYSLQLDLPCHDYNLTTLDYVHGKGMVLNTRELSCGRFVNDSRRGITTFDHNSALLLEKKNSSEAIAFNLLYSGAHSQSVEVDCYGRTRVLTGINPSLFEKQVLKGQPFETPEAIMLFCDGGRELLQDELHHFIEEHVQRGNWKNRLRPIMFSTSSFGYDFNASIVHKQIRKASELGIEGVLLSDGWFGARNNEMTSLGDWAANTQKFPGGIKEISDEVHKNGMLFGLWIEPELISQRSKLFEKCPEWVLQDDVREQHAGKHDQYLLDITRPDVYKFISEVLKYLVVNYKLDYLKWDMDHQLGEIYTTLRRSPETGEYIHQYILSLYSLLQDILKVSPSLLIDMGSRLDLGILAYSCSSVAGISATLFYPQNSLRAEEKTPSNSILFTPTCSLDLTKLGFEQEKEFKEAILFYKQHRKVIQYGTLFTKENIWTVSNSEKDTILAMVFNRPTTNTNCQPLKIQCVKEDSIYIVSEVDPYKGINENEAHKIPGDTLKYAGLQLATCPDRTRIFIIKEIGK